MASTNHTTNYNLPQWVKTDPFQMEDFNEAFAAIDTAVKNAADAAAGGVKIATGTYTGNGQYGQANARSLTVDFKPYLLVICTDAGVDPGSVPSSGSGATYPVYPYIAARGMTTGLLKYAGASYTAHITWANKKVSWYAPDALGSTHGPRMHLNVSGTTYNYLIIGV